MTARPQGRIATIACGASRPRPVAPLAPTAARVDERAVVVLQRVGELLRDAWRAQALVLPEGDGVYREFVRKTGLSREGGRRVELPVGAVVA